MSVAAFFDAARALKREMAGNAATGLTQDEVDGFNAIIGSWQPIVITAPRNPTALSDAGAFFSSLRTAFGALAQSQVDGFQALLQAFGAASWPINWAAYGLATAWHETNAQMEPVEEAYYLGNGADAYRRTLRYFPWYGRGYAQCTWEKNYRKADVELGLNGALIADPSLALKPDIAARILVSGMEEGWFTGIRLDDYLPEIGRANARQFTLARQVINGKDKADLIAGYALKFQDALETGGWA